MADLPIVDASITALKNKKQTPLHGTVDVRVVMRMAEFDLTLLSGRTYTLILVAHPSSTPPIVTRGVRTWSLLCMCDGLARFDSSGRGFALALQIPPDIFRSQLPDILASLFTPNEQSFLGATLQIEPISTRKTLRLTGVMTGPHKRSHMQC